MQQTDISAPLYFDYAAGALSPAMALLARAHMSLSADARRWAETADAAGAAFLEDAPVAPVQAAPLLPGATAVDAPDRAVADDTLDVAALLDGANWRKRPLGVWEADAGPADATLVRLPGGGGLPAHDHAGDEWTLVLSGAFEDESGVHRAGDLCFAEPGVTHRPRVQRGEDCVCLVVRSGPMRMRGVWGALSGASRMARAALGKAAA
ncbi:MAG: cupin domain-containing protein [Alphaproteobacteria bacterium]|nr:cupin domain-containing protein [Alphaproteobacteria bacterium]